VENFPLWAPVLALTILLLLSAFFSMAETAMMAISRLRLRHLAREGSGAVRLTQFLLDGPTARSASSCSAATLSTLSWRL